MQTSSGSIDWILQFLFRPWQRASQFLATRRLRRLHARVEQLGTAAEVENLLGPPLETTDSKSTIFTAEAIDSVLAEKPDLRMVYDDLLNAGDEEFESKFGKSKSPFFSSLSEAITAAKLELNVDRSLRFHKHGANIEVCIDKDDKVLRAYL